MRIAISGLTAAVVLVTAVTLHGQEGPTHQDNQFEERQLVGREIRTKRVNESLKGYSENREDCVDAPAGMLIDEGNVDTDVRSKSSANVYQCSFRVENEREIAPGITAPQRICLRSSVKISGGLANLGKRAKLRCEMSYGIKAPPTLLPAPANPSGRDALSVMPLAPADIRMWRSDRSMIQFAVPLDGLHSRIEPIREGPATLDRIRFSDFRDGSRRLTLTARLRAVVARCSPTIRLAMPAARFSQFGVQISEVSPNCRSTGWLGDVMSAGDYLAAEISKQAKVAIINKIFVGDDFAKWGESDPDLAAFLDEALTQGHYCLWRDQPALCITLSWPDRSAVENRERDILAKVPVSEGAVDRAAAQAKFDAFYAYARQHQMYRGNGLEFPAGFKGDEVEDADMGIFGGLLCRAGIQEGCDLLRTAQNGGRFFRSPRRIGEVDQPDKSTFSGDQLKGVLHYYTMTFDRTSLQDFLLYARSQQTIVPSPSAPLLEGYSSCPNRAPNYTCLLIGQDWYTLRRLATAQGLAWALPPDLAEREPGYEFDVADLNWEGVITNNGYRLHLIANTAWILKTMGIPDPSLDKTLKLLAGREPENAFFNYLVLGADRRVQRLADQYCHIDPARAKPSDWIWQRADLQETADESMVWDCVFIYKLLLSDPMPIGPLN